MRVGLVRATATQWRPQPERRRRRRSVRRNINWPLVRKISIERRAFRIMTSGSALLPLDRAQWSIRGACAQAGAVAACKQVPVALAFRRSTGRAGKRQVEKLAPLALVYAMLSVFVSSSSGRRFAQRPPGRHPELPGAELNE